MTDLPLMFAPTLDQMIALLRQYIARDDEWVKANRDEGDVEACQHFETQASVLRAIVDRLTRPSVDVEALRTLPRYWEGGDDMVPIEDGEWVKWADVAALLPQEEKTDVAD